MRISWGNRSDFSKHGVTPGIAPKKPIQLFGSEIAELLVARHLLVAQALGHKRNKEVVRAPDERCTDSIRVLLTGSNGSLKSLAVITRKLPLELTIDQIVQPEVARIHKRVILIMAGLFLAHPGFGRGKAGVEFGISEKPPFARR